MTTTESIDQQHQKDLERLRSLRLLDKGAGAKRARYHSGMLDTNISKKNMDFETLPETYVIFITENDVIGRG